MRLVNAGKIMSKDGILRVFSEDERKWAELPHKDVLEWNSIPWPMLAKPSCPDHLDETAITAYALSPHGLGDRTIKDRLKEHIRRWHPDRFNHRYLHKVVESQREAVKTGAELVIRTLNEVLRKQD